VRVVSISWIKGVTPITACVTPSNRASLMRAAVSA
jgi:hypothetical protein